MLDSSHQVDFPQSLSLRFRTGMSLKSKSKFVFVCDASSSEVILQQGNKCLQHMDRVCNDGAVDDNTGD